MEPFGTCVALWLGLVLLPLRCWLFRRLLFDGEILFLDHDNVFFRQFQTKFLFITQRADCILRPTDVILSLPVASPND
ncbi:hypothetical protein ALHIDCOG_00282 [Klebsiella phage CPRSB]|nr:hypothetical protein ALHIDCOG_00282 [Klebsiella phage CPRSB]